MSQHGEAAEQVVDMATNMTVKGVEVVANLTGKGAVSLATFLIAALKDTKRTKGRVRMRAFNGKPTKVFVIRREDMKQFAEEAKKYGILYAAVFNKKENDGIVDVVVNADDAAKVNRISERFAMSVEEVEKLREEILKSREEKAQDAERERTAPPDEKTHTVDDNTLAEMMGAPAPQQTEHKQPIDIGGNAENPTMEAQTARSNPSEPLSGNSRDSAVDNSIDERPSIKQQIKEIKEERKARAEQAKSQPKYTKNRETVHEQPKRKRTSTKER